MNDISDLFDKESIHKKINQKLPYLFTIAEAEASRGGKIGMEIGSVRERIIIAMLRYYCGKKNVIDVIPITNPEVDVILFNNPISIKTKSGKGLSGIKAVWTVDWEKVHKFVDLYQPSFSMIFIQIVWNTSDGGFFLFP